MQNELYAFIISVEFGFMIAQDNPFVKAIVKNDEVKISLCGNPKEMFEIPRIVFALNSSVKIFTHFKDAQKRIFFFG